MFLFPLPDIREYFLGHEHFTFLLIGRNILKLLSLVYNQEAGSKFYFGFMFTLISIECLYFEPCQVKNLCSVFYKFLCFKLLGMILINLRMQGDHKLTPTFLVLKVRVRVLSLKARCCHVSQARNVLLEALASKGGGSSYF